MDRVVVDTSVWINFFNKPNSRERMVVDLLLDADRVVLSGIELCELLQGTKDDKEANMLISRLSILVFLEIGLSVWKQAGLVSSFLRRKGIIIPLSDIILATVAVQNNCQIFTLDPHFECIPHIKLFSFSTK